MLIQKAKGQPPHQATFDKKSGNASLEQAGTPEDNSLCIGKVYLNYKPD